jgi:hypothetical protein
MSDPSTSSPETPAFLIGVTSPRQRREPAASAMTTHKFAIGQTVQFRARGGDRGASSTNYRVVAHRPVAGGEPWYLVQSELERHGRVAPESDLR